MNTKFRKGKNPGEVDAWLDSLGYYRKNVAYDETCLFRAVSEQLFYTQIYHERVRKECIEYGRNNFAHFQHLVEDEKEWMEHLRTLEIHMVQSGDIELEIISRKYRRDILVFDGVAFQMKNVSNHDYPDTIMLCVITRDHYDAVYKREHIAAAGFCQSIIYSVLYEEVLQVPNVQSTVQSMLYDKSSLLFNEIDYNENEIKNDHKKESKSKALCLVPSKKDLLDCMPLGSAPFPYKVAKALDPSIYRNIEYDTWTEIRRELRMGEWYYGDENLIRGTSCKLRTESGPVTCCIQDFVEGKKECVVFIWTTAERKTVKYEDLSPIEDAKPWPLPYRFCRNLTLSIPASCVKTENTGAVRKRNKKGSSSVSSSNSNTGDELTETNFQAFEGCPLMQVPHSVSLDKIEKRDVSLETEPQHFSWEAPWSQVAAPTPEPLLWPPSPSVPNMLGYGKPLLSSTPVIPDIVPFGGSHIQPPPPSPYIYPYPNPTISYMWPNSEYLQTPDTHPDPKTDSTESSSGCKYVFYSDTSSYASPTPNIVIPTTSPQVYPPPVFVPPGTPIIYGPPVDVGEMLPPPPMPIFSPPIYEYLAPNPYVYPQTQPPPMPWYPPGVNAQGFIFPSGGNTQNVK